MNRRLLGPRWILAHLTVISVALAFVFLGLWQLDRHDERRDLNTLRSERLAEPAVDWTDLQSSVNADPASVEYRRVRATGTFLPDQELLIRSQVHLGTAGFHVVTPLETGQGRGVLVNRGWVPLTLDSVPVALAPPPTGNVTVEGWVRLTQVRPPGGSQDSSGRQVVFSRVDVDRLQEQVPIDLAPVYLVMAGERGTLPEVVREPGFEDNGPHLAYAIQWFGFALVGVVGYLFMARKGISRGSPRD